MARFLFSISLALIRQLKNMEKSAHLFKSYYEDFFVHEDEMVRQKLVNKFFDDFVRFTPKKLDLLKTYITTSRFDFFYQSLMDLKYLVEFSDNINRYWYLLRAYSGALSKLKANQSVKESKKLYSYYFEKYGDRRMLRNEHWFEKKRWEFLDELQLIYREDELSYFIKKYQLVLSENLDIYVSFIMAFITDLIESDPSVEEMKKIKTE